jgi:hypothetical protein
MTAKPETNFWKNLKTCLEGGNFLVSRIESYATPGFPDCIAFHKDTGFITLELKVLKRSKKGTETVLISPLQNAWHMKFATQGAPAYILVYDPDARTVNVFHGTQTPKLRQKDTSKVKALWSGEVSRAPAALMQLSEARKLPNSHSYPQPVDN